MELFFTRFKAYTWIAVPAVVFASAVSGIFFVFVFWPHLFLRLDFAKLSILGLGISGPMFLLNLLITGGRMRNVSTMYEIGDRAHELVFFASLLTVAVLFIPALLEFYVNISARTGVGIAICLQFVIIVIAISMNMKEENTANASETGQPK